MFRDVCLMTHKWNTECEAKGKVNVTLSLYTTWWHVEVEAYLHSFLTWELFGGEWSASRSGRLISSTRWVGRGARLVVLRKKGKNVARKRVWVFILVRCYPALFESSTLCVMKLCYVYLKYFNVAVCTFEKRSEFISVYNVEGKDQREDRGYKSILRKP